MLDGEPAGAVVDQAAHVDAALSWLGPGSLGLAQATTHGPWADIYVRAIGPDISGVLCGVLKPPGVTCPT